ncbi:MAG: hypothetical protein JWL76_1443 [Thermoleophilia bacterium]|nr:hypothetical protein [Thermoleophilia bacterium]
MDADDLDELKEQLASLFEIDETPESFAHGGELLKTYGEAMLHAQLVERSLTSLLVIRRFAETGDIDTIDATLSEIRRDSMGAVLQLLEREFKIRKGTSKRYNNATGRRNRLAHDFFVSNFREMFSDHGRDALIEQLRRDTEYFKGVASYFDSLVGPMLLKTDPTFLEKVVRMYASGEIDIDGNDTPNEDDDHA